MNQRKGNHYDKISQCTIRIEKTIVGSDTAVPEAMLNYAILKDYGFGRSIVKKILKTLEEAKIIKQTKKGLWKKGDE